VSGLRSLVSRLGAVRSLARAGDRPQQRVVVLGTGALALTLVRELRENHGQRYAVVGVIGVLSGGGARADLRKILDRLRPDRIVVALDDRGSGLPVLHLVEARSRGIAVEDGMRFYERVTGKMALESVRPDELVFLPGPTSWRGTNLIARWSSLVVAAFALAVLAPVLAVVALAIVLDSGRPVLFVQDRVGLRGRTFRLIKFRTMRNASAPWSEWTKRDDDRVTPVGRILRGFRLDELPQLINVLKGEMNLVGPRPHPASNYEVLAIVARNVSRDGGEMPCYALRTAVPPGITGWAQVRYGYANGIEEEIEKLRYDLYYVEHRSIGLDIRILFDTIRVAASGSENGIGRRRNASDTRPGAAIANPDRVA
jgi:lipopolysaccharide/colanic/teichoic acid biosynthesis glycosyltransferase